MTMQMVRSRRSGYISTQIHTWRTTHTGTHLLLLLHLSTNTNHTATTAWQNNTPPSPARSGQTRAIPARVTTNHNFALCLNFLATASRRRLRRVLLLDRLPSTTSDSTTGFQFPCQYDEDLWTTAARTRCDRSKTTVWLDYCTLTINNDSHMATEKCKRESLTCTHNKMYVLYTGWLFLFGCSWQCSSPQLVSTKLKGSTKAHGVVVGPKSEFMYHRLQEEKKGACTQCIISSINSTMHYYY